MRKRKLTKSIIEAEERMQALLKRVGYTGKFKGESPHSIPNYRVEYGVPTSDKIGNGVKRRTNRYSGNEIMGISEMHKSNAVPIRRDNKQAAVDAAQMRRS
jgi:hypothetical protein